MIRYEIKFYDWNNNVVGQWLDVDREYIANLFKATSEHGKENMYDILGLNDDIDLRLMILFDNNKNIEIESFIFN